MRLAARSRAELFSSTMNAHELTDCNTLYYYPTAANTVQITAQIYSNISVYSRKRSRKLGCCISAVENLFAVRTARTRITVALSLFH